MKRLCALLICLLLTCAAALAADIPEPTEDFYVYDGANVLDYETRATSSFATGNCTKPAARKSSSSPWTR